jgi:hypothetical protein
MNKKIRIGAIFCLLLYLITTLVLLININKKFFTSIQNKEQELISVPTRGTWKFGEIKKIEKLEKPRPHIFRPELLISFKNNIDENFNDPNKGFLEWKLYSTDRRAGIVIDSYDIYDKFFPNFLKLFNYEISDKNDYINLTPKKGVDTSKIFFKNLYYFSYEDKKIDMVHFDEQSELKLT